MCGRFAFYSPSEAAVALFGVDDAAQVEPCFNIAPTQYIAAIREGDNRQRELKMLRWGLIPRWAKDKSIGNRMINARAETVAEKPSFRAAFRHRRCIVLADGFYEWHRSGDVKVPHFITTANDEPFAMAAIWESWADRDNGDTVESTALITTAANDFMQPLHHRMPVILNPERATAWLEGADMLATAAESSPPLKAWPVDRKVNNARNQGEDLINAVGDVRGDS